MSDEDVEFEDADFEDEDAAFADDNEDADFADNDDDFGDDGDDDWGDVVEAGDVIQYNAEELQQEMKSQAQLDDEHDSGNEDNSQKSWTCLECNHKNVGAGLLCLGCNKPNLGELDRQKNKREFKEAKYWTNIYKNVYLPLQFNLNSGLDLEMANVQSYMRSIFEHEMVERKIPDLKKYDLSSLKTHCESCTLEFDQVCF